MSFAGPPRRFRISIAAALMTCFGGLVFVGVFAVLGLGFWTAAVNTRALLGDKATLTIDLLSAELRRRVDAVVSGNLFLAGLVRDGRLNPRDQEPLMGHMRAAMAATPHVLGMGYLTPELTITRVTRETGAATPHSGDVSHVPLMRQALAQSRASKKPFWGELVRNERVNVTLINLRTPIWRGNSLIGTLSSVVAVSDVSRALAELGKEDPSLVRFVLYGDNHVLAHPSMAGGNFPQSDTHPIPRLDQIDDPILARLWDSSRREPMFVKLTGDVQGHVVRARDTGYAFFYRRISDYAGLPLTVGAYVRPGSGLAEEIQRLAISAAVAVAVTIIAVGVSLLVARRLSRPVRQFAAAARRVEGLDLDEVPALPHSRLRDLDDAAGAFNAMVSALRWFETYVPRKLVRSLIDQGGAAHVASQERDVTVMFTDIAGFTALAQRMTAADTATLLNEHFSLLAACIEAEDGTLDKYIGDSVMAFWGPPLGGDDHAVRACRAALAISTAVEADNSKRTARDLPPIRIRVGLHTGPAIVGNIGAPGRVNYTLVGDTVNVAQRVEQLVKRLDVEDRDVRVALSAGVVDAIGGGNAFEGRELQSYGVQELPGRRGGLKVYRLK